MNFFTIFLIVSFFLLFLGFTLTFLPFGKILTSVPSIQKKRQLPYLNLDNVDDKRAVLNEVDPSSLTEQEMLGFLENNTRKLNWSLQKSLSRLDQTLEKLSGDSL